MTASLSRYLVCALLAIAMLPGAAQAAAAVPVPAADALTSTAHSLALAHWGVEPCGGQVAVTWAHMGAGINARSQWMSVDIHTPATYSQCSITYNLDVDWDWPKLCTVIEHELGHLAGHEHVNDPHDVMSPYYVFPTPECAAGVPAAPAAPAPAAVAQCARRRPTPRKATSKRKSVKPKAKVKAKVTKAQAKVAKRKAAARQAKRGSTRTSAKKASRGRGRAAVAYSRDHAVSSSAPSSRPSARAQRSAVRPSDPRRRPLRLGEVALGHPLGRRDLRRVAQVPLGVERRLAAGAGGRDGLAVGVVDEVAGGEDARLAGARRAALGDDVALVVGLDLALDDLRLRLVADGDERAADRRARASSPVSTLRSRATRSSGPLAGDGTPRRRTASGTRCSRSRGRARA